jgi:hypothetical protein
VSRGVNKSRCRYDLRDRSGALRHKINRQLINVWIMTACNPAAAKPSLGLGDARSAILEKAMTIDERLERIEHVTAGLAEERRKDREEFRGLWRETQRQINDAAVNLGKLTMQVTEIDDRLGARIEALAEESRAADQRLGERIKALVSAMGEFIASQTRKQT